MGRGEGQGGPMTDEVEFTKRADKQFQSLPAQIRKRVATKIERLAQDPRPVGVVKLSGEENAYRIRVGNYRAVYSIETVLNFV